jgi:photosystem II stability/assembly factor-like uncharacterized protein
MNGKYVPTSPVILGGGQELLAMGGFSFGRKNPYESWFERSADGGRTWHASPASRSEHGPSTMDQLVFLDARRGWAGHWWTGDAGAVWHRWLPRGDYVNIAPSGSSAWADIADCRHETCDRDVVETVASPGASPRPLPAQPPFTIQPYTLVHPSADTGYVLSNGHRGADRMVVEASRDTGLTWQVHDTPCREPAAAGAFPDLAATGPDDLWLVCQNTIEPDESLSTVYWSRDGGTSWTQQTAKPIGENVGPLSPASGQVAWALSTRRDGSTSVLRTRNGGRSFTTVLDSRMSGFGTDEMTVLSPTSVTLSGFEGTPIGARLELVYTTHDGGRTWQRSTLPAPAGIPTTRG